MTTDTKQDRIGMKVYSKDPDEVKKLDRASKQVKQSRSSFLLQAGLQRAEEVLDE
jgi:uncharacterized protein (DUF1778 family)